MGPGIINTHAGGDSPFLLIRTYELVENLRAGNFPARWMPDAAFGLGYPFFNYYAALPYYLAAVFNVIGIDLITAIKLTQTLGMAAAALTMYRFACGFLGHSGAALAAVAYSLAPFHLVNIYVRGDSLSEFYAFIWYPLILWAMGALVRPHVPRIRPYITLTLALSGLLLTHNVSALLFAPFIAAYALAILLVRTRPAPSPQPGLLTHALVLLSAAALAMGLCAWFWLPALGETGLVQLEQQTTGYFNYANHFRSINLNLIQWSALFSYQVDPALSAIALSLPHALLAVLGTIVWGIRNRRRGMWLAMLIGLIVSTFMLTPLSTIVWRTLPLLALAQFPWRYLSVQAVFVAVLIGSLADEGWHTPGKSLPALVGLALSAILAMSTLWQLPNERLNVQSADITPHTIQLYEWQTGNIGTTIRAEYLPKTAQPWPRTGPALLGQSPSTYLISSAGAVDAGNVAINATLTQRTPTQQAWQIDVHADQVTFTLPLLAAPGWADVSTSSPTAVQAYSGSGWAMLTRPRGSHQVVLAYIGTSLQHTSERISIAAFVVLLLLVAMATVQRIKTQPRISIKKPLLSRKRLGIYVATTALASVTILIWASTISLVHRLPSMKAIDSDFRLFPHRGPLVLPTADGRTYTLTQASLSPPQIRAGDAFTLMLAWAGNVAPITLTAKLELPPPSAYAVNQRVFRYHADPVIGDGRQLNIPIAPQAFPGPTLIRLTLTDDRDSVFIIGPTVLDTPPNAPTQTVHVFSNGIALHQADLVDTSDQDLCVRAQWSRTSKMTNRADALQVSFRIMDVQGNLVAQADGQPQAGLAPTWSWPLGAVIEDSYCGVPTRRRLQAGEAVSVQVIWYRRQTLEEVDQVTLHGQWVDIHRRVVELGNPSKTK